MNDQYEHMEEQEEAHLQWTLDQQKWWKKAIRSGEWVQAILTWSFGIGGLILLIWLPYPKNIASAFICVLASGAFNLLGATLVESAQQGLTFVEECEERSRQSLEDIRKLKREWRGY